MATRVTSELEAAEKQVRIHSTSLHKELGFADLVLAQVLIVMVPEFFGTAVKAGAAHVVLWVCAILLLTTTYITYAVGPQAAWVSSNKKIVLVASVGFIAALMWVARLGLGVGKWVSNAGSVITLLTLVGLVVLPFFLVWRGALPGYHPLPLVMPPLTLFTLSVFSKMTFGALSGFEYVAIFAGECRDPGRHLARSVLIAAPVIALLYILGTSSILAFVSPEAVDIIGPVPQALSLGFRSFGLARIIAPVAILLVLANYLCSYTIYVSGMARLPMVAGWDQLVPNWFAHLHPKYRTPVNSILAVGGVALVTSIAVLIGVGEQEAFAQLQIWIWGLYGFPYLVMFAIPLLAHKSLGIRPALWLRVAAASGFLVVLLFLLLAVFPIVSVESNGEYTTKTVGVIAGANIVGAILYRLGRRKQPAVHG